MSDTLRTVAVLVQRGEVLISAHGYDELAEDGILAVEANDGVTDAVTVEDYPDYSKGPWRASSTPSVRLCGVATFPARPATLVCTA